jgi:hypothetical protein
MRHYEDVFCAKEEVALHMPPLRTKEAVRSVVPPRMHDAMFIETSCRGPIPRGPIASAKVSAASCQLAYRAINSVPVEGCRGHACSSAACLL